MAAATASTCRVGGPCRVGRDGGGRVAPRIARAIEAVAVVAAPDKGVGVAVVVSPVSVPPRIDLATLSATALVSKLLGAAMGGPGVRVDRCRIGGEGQVGPGRVLRRMTMRSETRHRGGRRDELGGG